MSDEYESYCDDVDCSMYDWTEPVARKVHRCVECPAPINVGEKHFAYKGLWDGDFGHGRQHFSCLDACMYIRDHVRGGECIPFGELIPSARHYTGDDSYPELRRLFATVLWRSRRHFKKKMTAPSTTGRATSNDLDRKEARGQ